MDRQDRSRGSFARLIAIGLVVVSTVAGLLLAELVARVVVNPSDFLHATLIDDPVVGHRIQPLTTGHDAMGFRNREVPERADIVAIGDSMTYGVSAPREGSWPQQLGDLLGERVYNMGLGGYGPLQYLHLARTSAATLKPRLLVVGFYFGNDIMDSYYVARGRPYWHSWRVSTGAESSTTEFDLAGQAEPKKRFETLRNWLSRNSVLYSMLRVTVFQRLGAKEQDDLARQALPDIRMLWNDASKPAVRTIFTPQLRLAAVDLNIRAVHEGMKISQKALAALKAETDSQGVQLLVLLIPTKERAYCRYLGKSGEKMPKAFISLCGAETSASAELVRFLDAQRILHIDSTPALESNIDRHIQIYPADSDGHPQSIGYEVIAREVAATVRRHFPKK